MAIIKLGGDSGGGGSVLSRVLKGCRVKEGEDTQERVRLLVDSPGASMTPSYSPGPLTTPSYASGHSTPSQGPSRNVECSNYKLLIEKIKANRKSGENKADLIETVKTVYLERVGKKFQYPHVWKILKEYPKWDTAKPIDGDNLQEVFGPDKRERPAGKQRDVKKQKSVETSGSTGGSQSESVSSFVSQDYRRKCDAAERAYEAQREKDLAIKKCEDMKFLMIDTSNLPPHKRAFIERQQAEIMRLYEDAGADDLFQISCGSY
ncbi:hypothetical protein Tco_0957860 [Tanacetum coccineum]